MDSHKGQIFKFHRGISKRQCNHFSDAIISVLCIEGSLQFQKLTFSHIHALLIHTENLSGTHFFATSFVKF